MGNKRVLLGLGIIAAGICAALPFRHTVPRQPGVVSAPPPSTFLPSAQPDNLPPAAGPGILVRSATTAEMPLEADQVSSQEMIPATEPEALKPESPRENPPPPMLPVTFHSRALPSLIAGQTDDASLPESGNQPLGLREYRIRKLDTLEDLAERFLGAREKAAELFEANRDVLKSPNLLPVGGVIRIPEPRRQESSARENGLLPIQGKSPYSAPKK